MQQLNALNPTCYSILLTETIFFLTNPEQPTAHQLSLTGLHYFRVNEHWGILIIGSTCLRPKCWVVALTLRFASGRSQQPDRSKSPNSRKASNRLPAQSPPPGSASSWPSSLWLQVWTAVSKENKGLHFTMPDTYSTIIYINMHYRWNIH